MHMKLSCKVAAGLLTLGALSAHAQVAQVDVWASACANCHGTDGRAQGANAVLAGQSQSSLNKKLLDFKNGRTQATVMHQIAKGYTDAQLNQIAGYFAAQKP
jgi:sulfide dehydrogenase cytochrome subunit